MEEQKNLMGNDEVKKPSQPGEMPPAGEAVPVPTQVRRAEEAQRRLAGGAAESVGSDDVVREYEDRYSGRRRTRLESGTPHDEITGSPPPSRVRNPYAGVKAKRSDDAPTDNERKWAALAHASTLLTALVALGSAGAGSLLTMFVPLLIYFGFRKRSDYVAFHALQAFTIQLVGTVGWGALIVAGSLVWVALIILAALLILALVGILLLPLVVLLGPIFFVVSLALPIGMVIYSVIATVETWNGHNYRYPFIGRWVESQLLEGHPVMG